MLASTANSGRFAKIGHNRHCQLAWPFHAKFARISCNIFLESLKFTDQPKVGLVLVPEILLEIASAHCVRLLACRVVVCSVDERTGKKRTSNFGRKCITNFNRWQQFQQKQRSSLAQSASIIIIIIVYSKPKLVLAFLVNINIQCLPAHGSRRDGIPAESKLSNSLPVHWCALENQYSPFYLVNRVTLSQNYILSKYFKSLGRLSPNRYKIDLSNEIQNIDFGQEIAKISAVKFEG